MTKAPLLAAEVPNVARLADLTWLDVGHRARDGAILAVPLGSTEQHGPHLPLSTDTDIAVALCEELARFRSDVLLAPAVPYGSSGEHAGFAGTLSIGQQAVENIVVELGRSAAETFDHVLFVSAHGGNEEPVSRAVTRLRDESRDVALFMPRWEGDPHAGRPETSMLLSLKSTTVRVERFAPGDTRPIGELLPLLKAGGVRSVSDSGVLGDPTGASAEEGRALLEEQTKALIHEVAVWREEASP